MKTELTVHRWKNPSKPAWKSFTTQLIKAALPESERALLPSCQFDQLRFLNSRASLKRSPLHRWWSYRNYLQIASLYESQR